jgi:hypothetical protein
LYLEIIINGGLFGYHVTVENIGTEAIYGNLSMTITTNARMIFKNQTVEYPLFPHHLDLSPGEKEPYNPGPVVGFGPATITIRGQFTSDISPDPFLFETTSNGFIFLLYTTYETTTITL